MLKDILGPRILNRVNADRIATSRTPFAPEIQAMRSGRLPLTRFTVYDSAAHAAFLASWST